MIELQSIYNLLDEDDILLGIMPCDSGACTIELKGFYGIFLDPLQNKTLSKFTTHLLHEWGHCKTGATHTLYSPYQLIEQNEAKANRCVFNRFLPFELIQDAVNNGYNEFYLLAEYFNIEEEFIRLAIDYYTQQCGKAFVLEDL